MWYRLFDIIDEFNSPEAIDYIRNVSKVKGTVRFNMPGWEKSEIQTIIYMLSISNEKKIVGRYWNWTLLKKYLSNYIWESI